MFLLNLSIAEFTTLLGALGGLVAALYLLDRTRRKRVVSTLRFWAPALTARETRRRKRVREPWSLILQLASLLLLLLAVAQLQFGSRERRGRDHVLLLDTSAWSGQSIGARTLLESEMEAAEKYWAALPSRDRILLVEADALSTPLTPFTSDRAILARSLHAARASFSSLNLEQALLFAQQAQNRSSGERGEIVYIGPGMISDQGIRAPDLPNLRAILVTASREHTGISGLSARRNDGDQTAWEATVTVTNYGARRANARLRLRCAETSFAPRLLALAGGEQASAGFNFATNSGGPLVAEIEPGSDLDGDHRIALALPRPTTMRVAVFTKRPEKLKPLLPSNRQLDVKFFAPSEYRSNTAADLIVVDQTAAAVPPKAASIWIDPPREAAPFPLKAVVNDAQINTWHSESPLANGLRAHDTHLGRALVFETSSNDTVLASTIAGPVVIARGATGDHGALAVIGFDPLNGQSRFELTTPLLFANLLRWSLPEVFQPADVTAQRIGAITLPLDRDEPIENVSVLDQQGLPFPFLANRRSVQIFVSRPEILRVRSGQRQRLLSVIVPDVAASRWSLPPHTAVGLPAPSKLTSSATDLWKALALLGALGLLVEWILFGRQRIFRQPVHRLRPAPSHGQQGARELAAR